MITGIKIKNFQSHKKTELEFSPYTNVIIGASDSGKSAIFRALNWAMFNRPLGDAYRSEWGGATEVALQTSEGDTIVRLRSDTKNEYRINNVTIKAFGTEVPEEIENILRLDSANVQSQMDMPFLLSSSPGEAAKLLNKAASIDAIDRALSNLKKEYNRTYNKIEADRDDLQAYQDELKQYSNIASLEKKLVYLEKQEKACQLKKQECEKLFNIIKVIQKTQEEIEKEKDIMTLLKKYDVLQKDYERYIKKKEKLKNLQQLIEVIIEKERDAKQVKESIKELEKRFKKLAPKICPLCGNPM